MKRIFFFLYGLICYLIFFVTFLYAIGFVGNFVVPKSIDYGYQGGANNILLINLFLLLLFAAQHSVMARQGFKKWWTKIIPKPIERSTYVLFTSAALILLFYFWRPMTGTIWNAQGTIISPVLSVLYFLGWFIVLSGTYLINHFNLFGLQQVYLSLRKQEIPDPKFVKPLFYRVVRHPLMLGFIIAFWAAPVMTTGHLLFAVATTGYILFAIQLEERDLVSFHGDEYIKYQHEVSQIIPRLPGKNVLAEKVTNIYSTNNKGGTNMALFMDIHKGVDGLTAEAVAEAHKKDLEKQGQYGVKYLKYWFNEKDGTVFCLSEAPDKESAMRVHKEAHGLMPDDIIEVKEGS